MKKIIPLLLLFFLTGSCKVQFDPLKTKYPKSYYIVIQKPYDEVWWKVLAYIGAKKYGTDTINKKDGIIYIKRMNYTKTFTFENSDGTFHIPDTYFVLGKYVDRAKEPQTVLMPFRIYIGWKVTVSNEQDGVKINIGYVISYFNYKSIRVLPENPRILPDGIIESTGKFEKEFLEEIK